MNTTKLTDEELDSRDPLQGISAALLRSEIGFWQELIETSEEPLAPGALERMEQALALAELRLKRMFLDSQQPAHPADYAQNNVYSITGHRA